MASGLEQFVNNVRTYSSHGNFRELCVYLNKSSETLVKGGPHLDTVLETLDLQQHSLGVLAVLCAKFSLPPPASPAQDNRLSQAQDFINGCNGEQVRLASDSFAELCHMVTVLLVEQKQAMRGISLLHKAIRKIQLFDSQLTSVHADLCQLCLLAKCFKPALQILDIDITDISQEVLLLSVMTCTITMINLIGPLIVVIGGKMDAKHFLLYYYYGGMIYLAVRNLERALYCFEVVVTTPALAVSHIMLEAYKKYILVSLLLTGKIQNIPKYVSYVVTRFIKPLSQPYHELANAFSSNSSTELCAVVAKHQETFTRDHNLGLVKQVVSMLHKKNIQRLTKTFLTLSLSDVASRVQLAGPEDAEKFILHMIEDGQIYATINQKDGMVVFKDEPDKYSGPEVLRGLESQLAACVELDKQITQMDEEIQVNPQYVKKASGAQEDEQPSKTTYTM